MEAEIGIILPQDKEELDLHEIGRDKVGFSPTCFRGSTAWPIPGFWNSSHYNYKTVHIYCLNYPV